MRRARLSARCSSAARRAVRSASRSIAPSARGGARRLGVVCVVLSAIFATIRTAMLAVRGLGCRGLQRRPTHALRFEAEAREQRTVGGGVRVAGGEQLLAVEDGVGAGDEA